MHTYIVCADGACSGNPGPGGFAWEIWDSSVAQGNEITSGAGSSPATTNNIMELSAARDALEAIEDLHQAGRISVPCTIKLRFDSEYVLKGIFEWMGGWKARGWRTGAGKPVANQEIWEVVEQRFRALQSAGILFEKNWVKGHAGDIGNERVDQKAVEMRDLAKDDLTRVTDERAPMTKAPAGGLDLMAHAHSAFATPSDLGTKAPAAGPVSSITEEQVALMRTLLAPYESGDTSIKQLITQLRANRDALGIC